MVPSKGKSNTTKIHTIKNYCLSNEFKNYFPKLLQD